MSFGKDGMWMYLNRGENVIVRIASKIYKETITRPTTSTRWVTGYVGFKPFMGKWLSRGETISAFKAAKVDPNAGKPQRTYVVELFLVDEGQIYKMEMSGGLMKILSGEIVNAIIDEGVRPDEVSSLAFEIKRKTEPGTLTSSPWLVKRVAANDGEIPKEAFEDFRQREAVKGNPVYIQELMGNQVDIPPVAGTDYVERAQDSKPEPKPQGKPLELVSDDDEEDLAILTVGELKMVKTIVERIADRLVEEPSTNVVVTIKKTLANQGWNDAKIKYVLTLPEVLDLQKQ